MNVNGIKTRGNGQGCAIRVRTNNWKAIVVIGYKDNDPSKPIRRTKSGFATKTEALAYIPTLKREKKKEKITFDNLYGGWSTSAMLKLSKSQQTKLRIAKKRLRDIWFTDITMLTIDDLQDVVNKQTKTYYPARDMKVLLSHLYERACAHQWVQTNLASYIELPTLVETEQIPFNTEEIEAFWRDYGEGNLFTGYLLLMIYSGMMPGELFECRKDMIDWEKQTIYGCGKKTKKRHSTPIVIADVILPVLDRLVSTSPNDMLFPHGEQYFYKRYKETTERCGARALPPYSCRHTTATVLADIENNATVIKEIMRHSKFDTTLHYIHKNTAPMLKAVNKIGKTNSVSIEVSINDKTQHN